MFPFNTYWMAKESRRQLATAIIQLRSGRKEAQKRFLDLLEQTHLLLPVNNLPVGYEVGDLSDQQPLPIKTSMIKTSSGKPYLTLYTSEAVLRKNHHTSLPYIIVPFHLLVEAAITLKLAGMIIDRNTRTWIVLPTSLLRRALNTKTSKSSISSQMDPVQAPLSLSPPPRVIAQNEIAALQHYLQTQKGLIKAYLFGLDKDEKRTILTVGLKYVGMPSRKELQQTKQEVSRILGESSILLLNQQREAKLDHQPGVIRFEMEEV